jgi:hypothetical protein
MRSPCCLCVSPHFFFFHAVRVLANESTPLVLPIDSFYLLVNIAATLLKLCTLNALYEGAALMHYVHWLKSKARL